MICPDCQGRGYPPFAPAGAAMPCRICGGSGIVSCCDAAGSSDRAELTGRIVETRHAELAASFDKEVVLRLAGEKRLLVRQELYHAVHTLEAQARAAKTGRARQRALTRRAADLRSVADQLR